jgi:hypothetical protein
MRRPGNGPGQADCMAGPDVDEHSLSTRTSRLRGEQRCKKDQGGGCDFELRHCVAPGYQSSAFLATPFVRRGSTEKGFRVPSSRVCRGLARHTSCASDSGVSRGLDTPYGFSSTSNARPGQMVVCVIRASSRIWAEPDLRVYDRFWMIRRQQKVRRGIPAATASSWTECRGSRALRSTRRRVGRVASGQGTPPADRRAMLTWARGRFFFELQVVRCAAAKLF